jgi:histidyl-tRNA synthetase
MASLSQVRTQGIRAELYPVGPRLKKILSYANHKKIPWVAIIGEDEAPNTCMLKNMQTGQQIICNFEALANTITKATN